MAKVKKRLTVKQAAEQTGARASTIRNLCARGYFPNAVRVESARGAAWEIPESDLGDYTPRLRGRPPKGTGTEE